MNAFETMPLWLAIPIALFLVVGSTLTVIGTWGFYRLHNFYDRLHAPTMGTSWGGAAILIASMALASWTGGRLVLHEIIIGIFIMITVPVTMMFVGRAAIHRDRAEGKDVPSALALRRYEKTEEPSADPQEPAA